MEDGDVERDLDFPQDDIERKTNRLENELTRVSTIEDKKVLWGALGILVCNSNSDIWGSWACDI